MREVLSKLSLARVLRKKDYLVIAPYCGHIAEHDHFLTHDQIKFLESVAIREFTDAIWKDLKSLEKVQTGARVPIRYYGEKQLETEVVCANCTLQYSVYGVFAFCPDCGQHNSLQILEKNLEVVSKMVNFSVAEPELSEKLIENALEDCVSAFDAFGRELNSSPCRKDSERRES